MIYYLMKGVESVIVYSEYDQCCNVCETRRLAVFLYQSISIDHIRAMRLLSYCSSLFK